LNGGYDRGLLTPSFKQLWTELGVYNPGMRTTGLDVSTLSTDFTALLDASGSSDISSRLSADLTTLLRDLAGLF
jgi:hypothetical protein